MAVLDAFGRKFTVQYVIAVLDLLLPYPLPFTVYFGWWCGIIESPVLNPVSRFE